MTRFHVKHKTETEKYLAALKADDLAEYVRERIKVGRKYYVCCEEYEGQYDASKRKVLRWKKLRSEMLRCKAVYPHHVLFVDKQGIKHDFIYFDCYRLLEGKVIT